MFTIQLIDSKIIVGEAVSMDLFFCICILFAIGSMIGWVIELFFRRFVSSKKWINPGFLVGPYIPLYGFGLSGLFLIDYYIRFDEWFNFSPWINDVLVILIMCIVMTLIEYIAGIIFIKGMGIKLWDYSDRKGNIQGIICPLFSLFWGVIAAFFHFFVMKVCENYLVWFATSSVNNSWLPFFLGLFYGVIIVDFGYSMKITTKIRSFAKEHNIVVRYEELKNQIRDFQEKAKEKISFVLPFKSETSLTEQLRTYLKKVKEEISEYKNKKNN